MPWRARDVRPPLLRRRASRPQLKRDPLGGALPPNNYPLVNSFVFVIARGAEARCSHGETCSPRPTTPRPRDGPAAPRTAISAPAAQTPLPKRWRAQPSAAGAARSSSVPSAPSNTRLELAAPGC